MCISDQPWRESEVFRQGSEARVCYLVALTTLLTLFGSSGPQFSHLENEVTELDLLRFLPNLK